MKTEQETETIFYFKNGIGNFVMMTPALQMLAMADRSGKIDVCIVDEWRDSRRQAFEDLMQSWKYIQNIIRFPKDKFRKYRRWFWTHHGENSAALPIFRSRGKDVTNARFNWNGTLTHESEYYVNAVNRLGIHGDIPQQDVPIAPDPILEPKRKGPKIVLCDGSFDKEQKLRKKWPHYPELADVLIKYYDANIYRIGFGKELKDVKCGTDFVGKLSITQTAKVISQADLFITTDTGNMHIGDALQVKMLAIFGGSLVSKNGPLSRNAHIIRADLPCQPCQSGRNFKRCEDVKCLKNLTVGDVMAKVKKLI